MSFLNVYISYTPTNNTEEFQFPHMLAYGHFQTQNCSKIDGHKMLCDVLAYICIFLNKKILNAYGWHFLIDSFCKSLISARSSLFYLANNLLFFFLKQIFLLLMY